MTLDHGVLVFGHGTFPSAVQSYVSGVCHTCQVSFFEPCTQVKGLEVRSTGTWLLD